MSTENPVGIPMKLLAVTSDSNTYSTESRCACGCVAECGLEIYQAFAGKYNNDAPIQNEKALDLKDEVDSDVDTDADDVEDCKYGDEVVIKAKRNYLLHHHHKRSVGSDHDDSKETSSELGCRFESKQANSCIALQKATTKQDSLNSLSPIELAHLTFEHLAEFDKHWCQEARMLDNSRSVRYSHSPILEVTSPLAVLPLQPQPSQLGFLISPTWSSNPSSHSSGSRKLPGKLDSSHSVRNHKLLVHRNQKTDPQVLNDHDTEVTSPLAQQLQPSKFPFSTALTPAGSSNPGKLDYSQSVRNHKLFVRKNQKTAPDPQVLLFGYVFTETKAQFKDPKEEVLRNDALKSKLTAPEWNNVLKSCQRYAQLRESKQRGLSVRQVLALKLYTDFDALQREYRTCFRIKNEADRATRQQMFVNWNGLLVDACKRASSVIKGAIYHGVSALNKAQTFTGTYYGPVSTTTDLKVAKQFGGNFGAVLTLEPAFQTKGFSLSWLSNYPDEKEVLYMNITFNILDIIDTGGNHSKVASERSLEILRERLRVSDTSQLDLMEDSFQKSLQKISVEANVISLNRHGSSNEFQGLNSDPITLLVLLYLQYDETRWQQLEKQDPDAAMILGDLREHFQGIAAKARAVQMDDVSAFIDQFLSVDQKEYELPFSLSDPPAIRQAMKTFSKNYWQESQDSGKHRVFNLQTIIRLFPEAEQISIHADNFDFSLGTLIAFLKKWKFDYRAISLKYIAVNFTKNELQGQQSYGQQQEWSSSSQDLDDDQRAIQELEKNNAEANIAELLKLGWRFMSPSILNRVPFDPIPEPPFAVTFAESNVMFYRHYTSVVLQRLRSAKSLPEEGQTSVPLNPAPLQVEGSEIKMDPEDLEPGASVDDAEEKEIKHNPKVCVLSTAIWHQIKYRELLRKYLSYAKFGFTPSSSKGPGATDEKTLQFDSFTDACDRVRNLVLDPMPPEIALLFAKTITADAEQDADDGNTLDEDDDDDFKTDEDDENDGKTMDENDGNDLGEDKDYQEHAPVPPLDLVQKTSNSKRSNRRVVCYQSIYDVFPHVEDIFLRDTEFALDECERLCTFLKTMKTENKEPFQRIFYKTKETGKNHIELLRRMTTTFVILPGYDDDPIVKIMKQLDLVSWSFQENGQIAFRKIYLS